MWMAETSYSNIDGPMESPIGSPIWRLNWFAPGSTYS
jgi:hypothetical protein